MLMKHGSDLKNETLHLPGVVTRGSICVSINIGAIKQFNN